MDEDKEKKKYTTITITEDTKSILVRAKSKMQIELRKNLTWDEFFKLVFKEEEK